MSSICLFLIKTNVTMSLYVKENPLFVLFLLESQLVGFVLWKKPVPNFFSLSLSYFLFFVRLLVLIHLSIEAHSCFCYPKNIPRESHDSHSHKGRKDSLRDGNKKDTFETKVIENENRESLLSILFLLSGEREREESLLRKHSKRFWAIWQC